MVEQCRDVDFLQTETCFIDRADYKVRIASGQFPDLNHKKKIQGDLTRPEGLQRLIHGGEKGKITIVSNPNPDRPSSREYTAALLASLKACAKEKDLSKGRRIHGLLCRAGLPRTDLYVGIGLLNMYAKCGALVDARDVLDDLPVPHVVSWNALIAGYVQHRHAYEALNCFEEMQQQSLTPDAVTYTCILKACGLIGEAEKGEEIHAEVVRRGLLKKDSILGTALVDMYAKCGALAKAQEVFDQLPIRNTVSWNALIGGYVQHGHAKESLDCFEWMQHQGLSPDKVTYTSILKACGSVGDAKKGAEIHAELVRQGLLEKDTLLGTALVDMYAKCGALSKAQEVFNDLPVQDVVSWSTLIGGYAHHGYGHEALNCFVKMQHQGLSPDAVTFIGLLKACSCIGATEKGEDIRAEVVRQGLLERNLSLSNALVDMYAKCGALAKAKEVFDELPVQNVVSWNAVIAGYAQHGHGHEALNCFDQMQQQGLSPDAVTFTCTLKACGSIGAVKKGEEIHAEVVRQGLLEGNMILSTALVDMYAKCGALAKAQEVFDKLPVKHVVAWNALIAGYAQHEQDHEALNYFETMVQQGLSPDAVTFTCILKVCGSVGAAEKGEEMHAEVVRQGLLKKDTILHTALVDMYAKCGALTKAQEVFDELPVRSVASWNALIAGYSQLGHVETVFNLFSEMIGQGIEPDGVTFIVLLNACSHSGLLDKGQLYYLAMSTEYGIIPTLDHHICMVDLFGRAGHFDKALRVIEKMQPTVSSDYHPLWCALLSACLKWGNVMLGSLAFDYAVQLDENDAAAYVLMGNMYAAASMQD